MVGDAITRWAGAATFYVEVFRATEIVTRVTEAPEVGDGDAVDTAGESEEDG